MQENFDYNKLADLISDRLARNIDKYIVHPSNEGGSDMSRMKQLVNINGESHWITGSDVQSLIESCIRLMSSISAPVREESKPDPVLFCEYADKYYSTYKNDQESNTMINRDRIFNNHVRSKFGKAYITDITTDILQDWMNDLGQRLSHETLLKIKNTMSPVLDSAVEDDIIKRNPFASKRLKIGGSDTVGHKAIPQELFSYMKEHIDELEDRERKLAVLLCYTGMRFEECLGLKHEDISDGTISITRAVVHPTRNLPEIKSPKTKTSVRRIPCHPEVLRVLGEGTGFVIPNKNGRSEIPDLALKEIEEIHKNL